MSESERIGVRFSLGWNQEVLKNLIAHGVEVCLRTGDATEWVDLIDRRLFGERPFDHGRWCLEMALAARDGKAASFYLAELFDCVTTGRHAGGLTLEKVRTGLAADDLLSDQFDKLAKRRVDAPTRSERMRRLVSPADSAEQAAFQELVDGQASELSAGRGAPQLLNRVAEAYLGIDGDCAGRTPHERLGNLVGSRVDLIDLLRKGMEGTVHREDLPSCDRVARLFDRHRVDWLTLPLMAGLHSLEQSGRLTAGDVDESRIRLAVTVLCTIPREFLDPDQAGGNGNYRLYRPEWFRALLRDDPSLVADVLRRNVARKLETGKQAPTELYELAVAKDHRAVAALASLPVLEGFPRAETDVAKLALCWSLHAALANCESSAVGRVIEERLGEADRGSGERFCWLGAGFLMAPGRHRDALRAGIDAGANGLKWLVELVSVGGFRTGFAKEFGVADLKLLVVALASVAKRDGLPESAWRVASRLIAELGGEPIAAATEALESLSKMPDLESLLPEIQGQQATQATKRREHEFRYGDIGQVIQTLHNSSPANAGDLAALVLDVLTELAMAIREGSTSDWRQHWNVDRWNRPVKPKPENGCRDAVLSDVAKRVRPLGIDAQREGSYAEDRRSDIRVSCGGFNVPVEIKRSCHKDLWTAIHGQLIGKYTRDPGAAGYGIYLVFWFGDTDGCRPTKCSGWSPTSAEEVGRKLRESLSDQERGLISICVFDVSKPEK